MLIVVFKQVLHGLHQVEDLVIKSLFSLGNEKPIIEWSTPQTYDTTTYVIVVAKQDLYMEENDQMCPMA
jgi:hypothetical protein